jgi:hypothetical protein
MLPDGLTTMFEPSAVFFSGLGEPVTPSANLVSVGVGGVTVVVGVSMMAVGGVSGRRDVSRLGMELVWGIAGATWAASCRRIGSRSGSDMGMGSLAIVAGSVLTVAGIVSLLSGLTFALLVGLLKTSLNRLAGDLPRSLLILFLLESGLKESRLSADSPAGEAGTEDVVGPAVGEGEPSSGCGSTSLGNDSADRIFVGLTKLSPSLRVVVVDIKGDDTEAKPICESREIRGGVAISSSSVRRLLSPWLLARLLSVGTGGGEDNALRPVPVLPLLRSSTAAFNSCSRCFLLCRLLWPGSSLRTPPLPPDLLLPSWLTDRALCLVGLFSMLMESTESVRRSWMVSSMAGSDDRRRLEKTFFRPFNCGEESGMAGAT